MITDTDLYRRQADLGLDVPPHAAIVGLGGTGAWVAMFLALLGVPKLTLIDSDTVETHNLNRLPLPGSTLGMPKVEAIAEEIARLRPGTEVIVFPVRFQPTMLEEETVLFDCTDNHQTQDELALVCDKLGIRYMRAGCDAESITVMRQRPGWGAAEGDGYGPQGVPIWVGPAVLSAIRAVGAEAHGWREVSGRIAEMA